MRALMASFVLMSICLSAHAAPRNYKINTVAQRTNMPWSKAMTGQEACFLFLPPEGFVVGEAPEVCSIDNISTDELKTLNEALLRSQISSQDLESFILNQPFGGNSCRAYGDRFIISAQKHPDSFEYFTCRDFKTQDLVKTIVAFENSTQGQWVRQTKIEELKKQVESLNRQIKELEGRPN